MSTPVIVTSPTLGSRTWSRISSDNSRRSCSFRRARRLLIGQTRGVYSRMNLPVDADDQGTAVRLHQAVGLVQHGFRHAPVARDQCHGQLRLARAHPAARSLLRTR